MLSKNSAKRVDNQILIIEPNIRALPASLDHLENISLVTLEECLNDASVLVLLTDHKVFGSVSDDILKTKDILDTRGVWPRTQSI